MLNVAQKRFAIVANGFADGPAQALRDYLVGREAGVITVSHPLVPEAGKRHEIAVFRAGSLVRRRSVALPVGPPASFALDPFVPLRMPRVDVWFGFNCVACARGLAARRLGVAPVVVYWCVDFVPDRFGPGVLTRVYDALDRLCCRRADARFELSAAARAGRDMRHGFGTGETAPVAIVPMGAWTESVAKVPEDGWQRRRVVFLGHLVPRQGVSLLIEALGILRARGSDFSATVIGGGPIESELHELAGKLGVTDAITFTGFVDDHRDVERMLAESSLAVAPYAPTAETFTRFADPGKLKAYVAAGLPVVLTAVPPNASDLADRAGAEIVPFAAAALADAIERAHGDETVWQARRAAALLYASSFDWNTLFEEALRLPLGLG